MLFFVCSINYLCVLMWNLPITYIRHMAKIYKLSCEHTATFNRLTENL